MIDKINKFCNNNAIEQDSIILKVLPSNIRVIHKTK